MYSAGCAKRYTDNACADELQALAKALDTEFDLRAVALSAHPSQTEAPAKLAAML